MANYTYTGDISARTGVHAAKDLLKRALADMLTTRIAMNKILPKKKSRTISFRKYEPLNVRIAALAEYVSDPGEKMTYTDVQAVLEYYSKTIWISDVIQDTHEDPVLQEAVKLLSEWMSELTEKINISVLDGGTNVTYAGAATTQATVASAANTGDLRSISRALRRNRAKPVKEMVRASADYATDPLEAAFIAMGHVDLGSDIRDLPDFIDVAHYSDPDKALPGEIGKWEDFRFCLSDLFTRNNAAATSVSTTAFISGGAAPSAASSPDVYSMIVVGQDAFGAVNLQGKKSVQPFVKNPGEPTKDDTGGRKGFVSITIPYTALIMQQDFIQRYEVCATANP